MVLPGGGVWYDMYPMLSHHGHSVRMCMLCAGYSHTVQRPGALWGEPRTDHATGRWYLAGCGAGAPSDVMGAPVPHESCCLFARYFFCSSNAAMTMAYMGACTAMRFTAPLKKAETPSVRATVRMQSNTPV